MTKRQIKKLLKLEQLLEEELRNSYTNCMMMFFPMTDNRGLQIPSKKKMIYHIEKDFFEKNAELRDNRLIRAFITRYVTKRYEVLK